METIQPAVTALAIWGALVVGAVYMTRAIRGILHGPLPDKWMAVVESTWPLRKIPYLVLLTGLMVFGFFPYLLVDKIKPAAARILNVQTASIHRPAPGVTVAVIDHK